MNRLSPLITRRVGRFAPEVSYESAAFESVAPENSLIEDVKVFALTWLGGMVFFWTYFS